MNNQRLGKLAAALTIAVILGTVLLYQMASVLHAHAQRSADAAAQDWQHQIALADLKGGSPEQVTAFLDQHGASHSGFAGGSATGFLFATVGPVARSFALVGPLQGNVSWYVGITFRFDGKRHLVDQMVITEERSA